MAAANVSWNTPERHSGALQKSKKSVPWPQNVRIFTGALDSHSFRSPETPAILKLRAHESGASWYRAVLSALILTTCKNITTTVIYLIQRRDWN